jgi:putative copper export protein
MADVIYVIMRWLHIASMATLIGGMIFGRLVMTQAAGGLSPDARASFLDRAAALYRPLVFASIAGLVISGLYNILTIPGHRPLYHMLLGIKLLLAMHVFAAAILIARPHNPRRGRMMAGAAISGLAIIAIAAYLRHIF